MPMRFHKFKISYSNTTSYERVDTVQYQYLRVRTVQWQMLENNEKLGTVQQHYVFEGFLFPFSAFASFCFNLQGMKLLKLEQRPISFSPCSEVRTTHYIEYEQSELRVIFEGKIDIVKSSFELINFFNCCPKVDEERVRNMRIRHIIWENSVQS